MWPVPEIDEAPVQHFSAMTTAYVVVSKPWGSFCWCPSNRSLTIWGLYGPILGPMIVVKLPNEYQYLRYIMIL